MITSLIQPLLAFTLLELAAILALLAIIAGALISIAVTLAKHMGGPSGPTPDQQALTNLQSYLTTILTQGTPVSTEQCQRLRQLLQDARTAGVSSLVLNQLSTQIDTLCPG